MNPELEIRRKPLTDADRALLINEANATPYIAMLTPGDLAHLEQASAIFYYYNGEEAVGFGAWQNVTAQWTEIGPFFNRDAFRGMGLGRRMFHDVITHLESERRSLYAITKNSAVKHMLEGYGFLPTTMWKLPLPLIVHMVRRFNVRRVAAGVRKIDRSEPTIHLVKTYPYEKGTIG